MTITTIGKKSMRQDLGTKQKEDQLTSAIFSTLAFFSLYDLPITSKRLHELLLDYQAGLDEVETALTVLALDNKIYQAGNLYSLKPWKAEELRARQEEIANKWQKIDTFYNWLAVLPFVRQISVINSLALGTADADSDIDFFVITKPTRLYFVRSVIIVLFRLLGVYKTRQKIKDKFCFGFFVSEDNLKFEELQIKPADPYFMFWLCNLRPIFGGQQYWTLMQDNSWLLNRFPNFKPMIRLASAKELGILIKSTKLFLEIILFIPAFFAESILRRIHINHTFKLAENNTVTCTTVANAKMLKLHASDIRRSLAAEHAKILSQYNGH